MRITTEKKGQNKLKVWAISLFAFVVAVFACVGTILGTSKNDGVEYDPRNFVDAEAAADSVLVNVEISNNTFVGGNFSVGLVQGFNTKVKIENCSFDSLSGIGVHGGHLILKDCKVSNSLGNGVEVFDGGTLTLTGNTNITKSAKNGIWAEPFTESTVNLGVESPTEELPQWTGKISENVGDGYRYDGRNLDGGCPLASLNMFGGEISENGGHGVFVSAYSSYGFETNDTYHHATINDGKISENGSHGIRSSSSSLYLNGGLVENHQDSGIYIAGQDQEIIMKKDFVVRNNRAENGGGIYLHSDNIAQMSLDATIMNNTATNGGGIYIERIGYVSSLYDATIGSLIFNNHAENGGGLYFADELYCGVDDSYGNYHEGVQIKAKVVGNNATNGGGVYSKVSFDIPYQTFTYDCQITGNSATNGGGFYVDNADATVSSSLNNLTIGGVMYVGNDGVILDESDLGNLTEGEDYTKYTGNSATNGGGLYNNGEIGLDSGKIIGNSATNGGGVYNKGSLVVYGATISDNTATNGGGIDSYTTTVGKGSSLWIIGGKITKNTATYGGGIRLFNNAYVDIEYGEISYNHATNQGGGISFETGAALEMSGGQVVFNTSDNRGAGINMNSGNKANFAGGEVSNNTSAKAGGGLFVHRNAVGELKFAGTDFKNNKTISSYGGAVHALNCTSISISDGEFSGNETTSYGGAFYISPDTSYRVGTMTGGTISGNSVTMDGGGIYIDSSSTKYMTFSMSGGAILNNNAVYSGGGIYFGYYSTFNMSGGEISHNTADLGGGICSPSNSSTLNISGSALINGNTAERYGGGVFGTINSMKGGTISNNVANENGGGLNGQIKQATGGVISGNSADLGGGIYSSSSSFQIFGVTICQNLATNGGGIYLDYLQTFSMTSGTISGNTATEAGGGIFINSRTSQNSTITISGGGVEDNTANNGGGVFVNREEYSSSSQKIEINLSSRIASPDGGISGNTAACGGGFYMKDLEGKDTTINISGWIAQNTATEKGGGLYIENVKTVNMPETHDAVAMNNAYKQGAVTYGGGMYVANSGLNISDACLEENSATYGGGIYATESTLIMSGGSIGLAGDSYFNWATAGGGIYLHNSSMQMTNGKIIENKATATSTLGAGVYLENSTLSQSGGYISENQGNAVFVDKASAFEMTGGVISGNRAQHGAGIYNAGKLSISAAAQIGSVNVDGSAVTRTGNIASGNGGGIYLASSVSPEDVSITGGSIVGNEASIGGGIFAGHSIDLDSVSVSYNKATSYAGGVFVTNYATIELKDAGIDNNQTSGSGGGIYLSSSAKILTNSGSSISYNTAGIRGAGIEMNFGNTATIEGEIGHNIAKTNGGGFFSHSAESVSVNANIFENEAATGGGMYLNKPKFFEVVGGTIELNNATGNAGGIFINSDGNNRTFKLTNVRISENSAASNGGAIQMAGSGNIDATLELLVDSANTQITKNTAGSSGGAIYCSGRAIFTMKNGEISSNTATSGGAIGSSLSNINISGGTISKNTAINNGGAIFASGSYSKDTSGLVTVTGRSDITISGTALITENVVKGGTHYYAGHGGAFDIRYSYILIEGGTISKNSVQDISAFCQGGGLFMTDYSIGDMTGGEFVDNYLLPGTDADTGKKITSHGGNVFLHSDCTFNMLGGTILGDGSTVQAVFGGGIANLGSILIDGGIIENCVATYGGGIASYGDLSYDEATDTTEESLIFAPATTWLQSGKIIACRAEIGDSVLSGYTLNMLGDFVFEGYDTSVVADSSYENLAKVYGEVTLVATNSPTIAGEKVNNILPYIYLESEPCRSFGYMYITYAEIDLTLYNVENGELSIKFDSELMDEYYSQTTGTDRPATIRSGGSQAFSDLDMFYFYGRGYDVFNGNVYVNKDNKIWVHIYNDSDDDLLECEKVSIDFESQFIISIVAKSGWGTLLIGSLSNYSHYESQNYSMGRIIIESNYFGNQSVIIDYDNENEEYLNDIYLPSVSEYPSQITNDPGLYIKIYIAR